MSSRSLQSWATSAAGALDQVEAAHTALGGIARGRRYTTLQVNQSYVVLLSSHFQAFCRDLHSEAVDHLVSSVQAVALRQVFQADLTRGRKLDHGNPNPGHLGNDFGRLGMAFWPDTNAVDTRNATRQANLDKMNKWRNAIAHQDFGPDLDPRTLTLAVVRRWRSSCNALSVHFDRVVSNHILAVTGTRPW